MLMDENTMWHHEPSRDLHAGQSTCLLKSFSCLYPTKSLLDLAVFLTQNVANFHSCGSFELLASFPAHS